MLKVPKKVGYGEVNFRAALPFHNFARRLVRTHQWKDSTNVPCHNTLKKNIWYDIL